MINVLVDRQFANVEIPFSAFFSDGSGS